MPTGECLDTELPPCSSKWSHLIARVAINGVTDSIFYIGNFGDVLAGFFAKKLGVPSESLVVATNENDILHRFWQTGAYEKNPVHGSEAEGGFVADGAKAHASGVKETLSPAMDILVSTAPCNRILDQDTHSHER